MSWTLLLGLILAQVLALLALRQRRQEALRTRSGLVARQAAREAGSHRARLQHPHVDLSRCIGCEACVKACPEEGVLELIHGQAVVVHGARCVGHARCADACPVGAIALTLADIAERRDIPVLTEDWESTRVPGLFLAGEVTGFALVRTAIEHGRAVADTVARRVAQGHAGPDSRTRPAAVAVPTRAASGAAVTALAERPLALAEPDEGEVLDLCIVGAGPAGLSCSLQAKAHGLRCLTLEQEQLGGTVARYPRRKLVLTQPVDLPLHGRLDRSSYTKEELMQLWQDVAERHRLPLVTGVRLLGLEQADGHLVVRSSGGTWRARHVCLALGRRGTPRKLGVPGEELAKVAYSLLDAQGYTGRRILVVGGGDSAVEAALGLAEQPGNAVTLSYRQATFSRIKARNAARVKQAQDDGMLEVLFDSRVEAITPDAVHLHVPAGERVLPNDEVFVMAGGTPPFELLERAGISFDPAERPAATPLAEQGTGLLRALVASLVLALAGLAWLLSFHDYYGLKPDARFGSAWHGLLRPSGGVGLAFGIAATALVLVNLAYLVRRARIGDRLPGSLKAWMTVHVVTGLLAVLLVFLHGAMAPRNTVGGWAFAAMGVLVVTGAIGRYLYSFVPRAANGRELAADEVRARVAALSSEWDRDGRGLADSLRAEIDALADARNWERGFLGRVRALLAGQGVLRRSLARLQREAHGHGVPEDQLARLSQLAREAHRAALLAGHYEDLRALLSTWRFLHRWVALLMVLLAGWHVFTALRWGGLLG